jgi:uroporphyrinogen III methyltransferase/synthase
VLPLIEIRPAGDRGAVDRTLAESYDWAVFTSANAVRATLDRGVALRARRVAAIGPTTARELLLHGIRSEALDAAVADAAGSAILLPRADIASDELPRLLRERGGQVTELIAYHTGTSSDAAAELRRLLARGVDVVTFFSPSAVRSFVAAADRSLCGARVACIGNVTAAAARAAGLPVDIVAPEPTASALAEAIAETMEVPA